MISEKLMMSLFALDAYSRSTNTTDTANDVRLFGLGSVGATLGGATIVATQNVPNSSFVAVAYSWNGKTVISFRGTDNTEMALNGDIANGWTLGAGIDSASQAGLAEQFYEAITGQSVFSPAANNVLLTGHSLGGGLAGYLSALSGAKAYGFDHMVFGPAAERALASHLYSLGIQDPTEQQYAALGLRLPDANQFVGTHVAGELLVDLRNGTYGGALAHLAPVLGHLGMGASWFLANMAQAQAAYEQTVHNSSLATFGWNEVSSPDIGVRNALHSQALLVLLQFAQDQPVGGQWISSGLAVPLLSSLYKDSVALSAGINSGQTPDLGISGKSNPADLMLTKIAYSVLDGGARPFGDSAIRSLFNDAESVGDFLNNGGNSLLDVAQVADNIARFAALQAQHAVVGQHDGFVSHSQDMLLVDYTNEAWTFGSHVQTPSRIYRDFSNFLQDSRLNAAEIAELNLGPNRFDAEYYSNAAGGLHGTVAFESSLYTVKSVGTSTHDTVVGTNGDEQIMLGGGNDTVTPNGGVNWIDGGDQTDTLIDEHAWSDFQIHFDGVQERYYFALRDSGADPRIHIVDNVEFFELDGELFNASNLLNVGPDGAKFSAGGLFYEGVLKAGEEVGRLEGLDGNEFDTFTWTLHPDSLVHYYLDGNIVRAREDITFDYESYVDMLGSPIADLAWGVTQETWWQQHVAFMQSACVVKVTVKDSYGIAASANLVVGVANVNEVPDGLRLKNPVGADLVDHATLSENVPIGTLIMTASARDDDGDEIVWSLIEDGQGRFRIDPSTGDIFVHGVLDYETLGSLELIARATDAHGAYSEVALNITLTDVPEGIDGTPGDDILHGTIGADVINGFGGKDTIYGHEANDRLYGGANDDTFYGGTGSDAMFGDADNDTFHLGEALEGDVDYVNGGAHTGTGDTVQLSVGAKFRLDAAGAAAIRGQVIADGFTAPTGHGVGIEMDVGDAFVQAVETFKAAADLNEIVIGTAAGLSATSATSFDFTAGMTDTANYDGSERAILSLTGDAGRSKAIQIGANAVGFFGIDVWNLTGKDDEVYVNQSHLGTQTVAVNAGEGYDRLDISGIVGPVTYHLDGTIGGTNIVATGFERVHTGAGNDTFHGGDIGEYWHAGGGTNTLMGSLGADTAISTGNLIVDYSASAGVIYLYRETGTSNASVVNGATSAGPQSMGSGDYLSATGWSRVTGSAGTDALSVIGAYGTLISNGGDDRLIGWKNNDTFFGADGYYETITPGDGNDIIHFGTGGGTLDFSTSTRAAVIDMAAGKYLFGDQEDTVTGEYSKIVGTSYGDRIEGTNNGETIDGGAGSAYDVIYGYGGDDTITFGTGTVHGGEGVDTIKALRGYAIIFGEGGNDKIEGSSNALIYGGDGDDTISASSGSTIYGGDGVDTISAFTGSTIYGDDGDDILSTQSTATDVTIHGGAGADTMTFHAPSGYAKSAVSYSQSDAGVSLVRTGTGIVATGGHAQGDTLLGTFNVIGSAYADTFDLITSDTGWIKAGAGDDTITLRQSGGSAYGEAGEDTFTLTARDQKAYGGLGDDTFHGFGTMYGDEGDDEFFLGYGEYYPGAGSWATVKVGGTVYGGTGSNIIRGGQGNDNIHMGEGSDTFIFSMLGGRDTIFGAGADDSIVLNNVTGFDTIADIQANLYVDSSGNSAELRFGGSSAGMIVFSGMAIEQVLALDWSFV